MENKVILKIRAGSHLYGLNTPESDRDEIGVYLNLPEELLGLQSSEVVEDNVIDKHDNGRNTKDAVDCKYYSLQKFCNLALRNNPSILELLFANKENILYIDEYGEILLSNRHKFLSKNILNSYAGYAFDQQTKSQVKTSNLRELVNARDVLTANKYPPSFMLYNLLPQGGLSSSTDEGVKISRINGYNFINVKTHDNKIKFNLKFTHYPDYVTIGDLNFNNQKIKDVIRKLNERINKASYRADGMLASGMDYKFISHTLRLIKEGEELLSTGNLVFPLKDRKLLLQVKLGLIPPQEVMELIGDINLIREEWKKLNVLPSKPDFKLINNMIISIYKEYLKEVIYGN